MRELATWVRDSYEYSERRATQLAGAGRSTHRYASKRDRPEALRQRLKELAAVRVRCGYRRWAILLRREGWNVNAQRLSRLHAEEDLTVRTKKRKKEGPAGTRAATPAAPIRPRAGISCTTVSPAAGPFPF